MLNPMRPFGRFFKASALNKRRPLRLERLESREVPASLITAVQVGSTLTITGLDVTTDPAGVLAGDNDQDLTITGAGSGAFDVSVNGATLFQLADKSTTAATQSFKGVNSIKLDMRQGNDLVTVNKAQLSGELIFLGGGDNDTLTIGSVAGNQSFGKMTVTNGDGDDVLVMGNGVNTVVGALTINNGTGNSQVTLNTQASDELTLGSLAITNTNGADALLIEGKSFKVNGATSINNGNGDTITKIAASSLVQFSGAFVLSNGEGFDQVALGLNDGVTAGALTASKGITITNKSGGSDVTIDGLVSITGNLAVTNTDGSDNLAVGTQPSSTYTQTGNVTINNGSGGSDVSFGGGAGSVTGAMTLTNAVGLDNFTISNTTFALTGALTITNGSGGSFVSLTPTTSLGIGGLVKVTNTAGGDVFLFGSPTGKTATAKGVTINNGAGGSLTQFAGASVQLNAALAVLSTDGADALIDDAKKFNVVGGGASFKSGAGDSNVQFNSVTLIDIGGALVVENGSGDLSFAYGVSGATNTSKGLSWKNANGDTGVTIDGTVTVNGTLTATNGMGLDALTVAGGLTVTGAATINNGIGGSDIAFNGKTKFGAALTVTNLDGADQFDVSGLSFEVVGVTTINNNLGDGTTSSQVQFAASTNTFTGGLTIKAVAGADSVAFSNTTTAKSIAISLGNDSANVEFTGNTTVTAALSITTLDGADSITIDHQLNVGGATTISTGTGNDTVLWAGVPSSLVGVITIKTGDGEDALTIADWTTTGALTVDTGAGNDVVMVDNSTFNGTVALSTGNGSDNVFVETQDLGSATTFKKALTVKLDTGSDVLEVGIPGDPEDDIANFESTISVDAGAGLDQIHAQSVAMGGTRLNVFPSLAALLVTAAEVID